MDQIFFYMISYRPWILKVVFFINWNKFFKTEKFFNFFDKFETKYFAALFRGEFSLKQDKWLLHRTIVDVDHVTCQSKHNRYKQLILETVCSSQ